MCVYVSMCRCYDEERKIKGELEIDLFSRKKERERAGKIYKDSESAGQEQKESDNKGKQITEVENRKQMGRRDLGTVKSP